MGGADMPRWIVTIEDCRTGGVTVVCNTARPLEAVQAANRARVRGYLVRIQRGTVEAH